MTIDLQLALGTVLREAAILVLADGSVFPGYRIGSAGHNVGEVVFNTAMTGYQEILTDPSYSQQMVTLTYAHIGNTGTNSHDWESAAVHAAGLIVRDVPECPSNFRSDSSLSAYLNKHSIVGIAGVDTRKLTRLLSSTGAQNGCIFVGENDAKNVATALKYARSFGGLKGLDLAKVVSIDKAYDWTAQARSGEWQLKANGEGNGFEPASAAKHHVVAYDFGAKHNILRMMASRGCKITVVPAQTSAADVLALKPDGVFLSNGPGDPEPCDYAIAATKVFIAKKIPVFGICLGHQILALAAGAKTLKMSFGHHGANHPVKDLDSGRVMITSQNHGFAVDAGSLPANVRVTHVSLFDHSIQGIALTDAPAFGFQGHPEASPGPHDVAELFDRFTAMMGKQ